MTILTTQASPVRAGSDKWQQHIKHAIRDAQTLREHLKLPNPPADSLLAAESFPVFVPIPFLNRIRPGDPRDPLLLQVLPSKDEDSSPSHFSTDPLGESNVTLSPGLLKKYHGRVLLIMTGACAVHCRYCFRRHFPYQSAPKSLDQWEPALKAIAADKSITEVILSGGDPLTVVDSTLQQLLKRLEKFSHLKRLRIHTRLPIMIPARITAKLLDMISQTRLQTYIVIHANHANELDESVRQSLADLAQIGTTLLNQTVLLKRINDDATTLINLSQRLLDCGVLPYYLHQLDPVVGASHFEVPRTQGEMLIETMRAELPGYAVPRYVKEIAGQPNKTVWA